MLRIATTSVLLASLWLACTHSPIDTEASRKTAALELVRVYPQSQIVDDMVDVLGAKMTRDQKFLFSEMLQHEMDWKLVDSANADALARNFTLAEIQAMTDFYGSPEGQAIMSKMGVYMAQLMPVIQRETLRAAEESRRRLGY